MPSDAIRLCKSYEMQMPASRHELFPLLCPVRELEWVPYWSCKVIYSQSGVAEADCVFATDLPDRGKMTWVVTRYAPPGEIQYTVFKPDSHVWNLNILLEKIAPEESRLTWNHVFTGLTEAGNRYLQEYTDELHRAQLGQIESSLRHFLKTGEML